MTRAIPFVAVTAFVLVVPCVANAQLRSPAGSSAIAGREIDAHLRFLSHDLLEGRVAP